MNDYQKIDMRFKITPNVGPRYWAAIAIASMCGANQGDIVSDILKMSPGASLTMLAIMFAVVTLAERATTRGSEVFYWVAILIVRAAATNIADYSIGHAHFTYVEVSVALAIILIGLIALPQVLRRKPITTGLPPTGSLYWFTMLTAGSLGTVMADGIGHSFSSVQIGVPLSASIATVALLVILSVKSRMAWVGAASYWAVVVAVRWWGTNVGDMSAFFLSLVVSAAITGVALTMLLVIWRAPPIERADDERPLGA
ncbi:hypothetical protein [Burkholderia pyrrocinia]|uniref:hypothetical protein n=1 Tax=Burkholderia pyrrocinia TaxID=60550 RepID=UPI00126025EF|nr:hypothetical protein [Burkholderia pyrrocinia]